MTKKLLSTLNTGFAIFLLIALTRFCAVAQLNGSYTINSGANASGTNYKTFASAVSDLSSGTRADGGAINGPGVAGPVTFMISLGIYNEQVVIPTSTGVITGASATNTIIFDGGAGNATNVVLTSSGSSDNYATLTFNGCSYVVFKNLTITNTNTTNSWGVNFYSSFVLSSQANNSCNNNTLRGCVINTVNTSNSTAPNLGILFSSSRTVYNTIPNCSFITIDGCSLHGGFYSIYAPQGTGNVISNDSLLNYYNGGIVIYSSTAFKIRGNYISSDPTVSNPTGNIAIQINSRGTTSNASDYAEISGNTIYKFTQMGLVLQSAPGSAAYPTMIYNNFIGGGIPADSANVWDCVLVSGRSGYVNFWNNTLSLNSSGAGTSSACLQLSSIIGSNWSIENNICSYTGSSPTTGQPLVCNPGTLKNSVMDYNIFYNTANTGNEASINDTEYNNSSVIGGRGFNFHSQVVNPNFVNTSFTSPDLDVSLQCTGGGTALSNLTTDIHGTVRANPPCIGADEIINSTPDAAGTIMGTTPTCRSTSGVSYSVPTIAGATGYTWTLPSGATIATGANTRSITVDFSMSANSGNITVYGTNGCGNGASSLLAVTVHVTCP